MDKFCREQLSMVDQDEWRDELYVLRHSYAARAVFAKAQYNMTLHVGFEGGKRHLAPFYGTAARMFEIIEEIAVDVAHHHPIAYHRWNPRRVWVPGVAKFMRLAEEIGFEKKNDEYGETFIKTIDGWWMV